MVDGHSEMNLADKVSSAKLFCQEHSIEIGDLDGEDLVRSVDRLHLVAKGENLTQEE